MLMPLGYKSIAIITNNRKLQKILVKNEEIFPFPFVILKFPFSTDNLLMVNYRIIATGGDKTAAKKATTK